MGPPTNNLDIYNLMIDLSFFFFLEMCFIFNTMNLYIYPAMTAFTDQYSLPNICFDIGQL